MSDTSLVFNLIGRDAGVNSLLTRTSNNVRSANLRSAASIAAVSVAAASAAAHVVVFAGGVSQVAGVMVTLPAAIFTAVGAFAALKMATTGLGAALKQSSGAAGGAAFDYAAAEHRVEQAVRASLDAQKALDAARADAARSIAQLTRSLNGARLDEEGAILAVAAAEAELRKTRAGRGGSSIKEADLAYRQALQTLDEAKARTAELGDEQADSSKKGVEGSDAVQRALQQQADAQYDLAQAKAAAAKGATGGGGPDPAAIAFAKLSPAAKDLVTTIKQISPAWSGVQRTVQQAVWAGVAGDLRQLSATYLPVATTQLGRFGQAWNVAIRNTAGFLKTPEGVRQVNATLGYGAQAARSFGLALEPIVRALFSMGDKGGPAFAGLANDALLLAQRFERWIAAARDSGKLAQWAETGRVTLKQLLEIVWNIGGALVAVFRAGSDDGAGMLAWLAEATGRMSAFLNSAEGQAKIKDVLGTLQQILASVVTGVANLGREGNSLSDTLKVSGVVVGFLAEHLALIAEHLPLLVTLFIAYKMSQAAANVATVVSLPITLLHSIALLKNATANIALRGALNSHTVALGGNTASTGANTGAQNVGLLTRLRAAAVTVGQRIATMASAVATAAETVVIKAATIAGRAWAATKAMGTAAANSGLVATVRSTAAMVAHRAATIASAAAARLAAAGQWILNVAMSANPVGLIVIGILLLIGVFVLLWVKCSWFREFWIGLWNLIKDSALAVWGWLRDSLWPGIVAVWDGISSGFGAVVDWIVGRWDWFVEFLRSAPGKIASAAKGMWDGITSSFKGAINWLLSMWNRLDFGIDVKAPDWLGGMHFKIADIIPDIPLLESGGKILSEGLAVLHPGEEVVPAAEVSRNRQSSGGSSGTTTVRFAGNTDSAFATAFMRMIRAGLIQIETT